MSVVVLAACGPGETRVAAVDGDTLLDYAIWLAPERRTGSATSMPGGSSRASRRSAARSWRCRMARVSFPTPRARLTLTDGASVLVRVTRAAQGGKGPRLSARVTGSPRRGPGAVERLALFHPQAPVRVDDPAMAAALRPALGERITLVRPPAFDAALEAEIEALGEPSVPLPGGGSLSVHPTPALIAIDLDAGGAAAGRAGKGAMHRALNEAALPVLARQIRLRNLSGAILIDWAGLSPRKRTSIGPALAAALADDPLRPRLLGFTHLGLAEIVRTRVHPPLHELLAGPHAAGLAALRRLVAEAAADPARPRALRVSSACRDRADGRQRRPRRRGAPDRAGAGAA